MISSPSLYDPVQNPVRARERRNLVLDADARGGDDHPARVRGGARGGAARSTTRSTRPRPSRTSPTSRAGSPSSSWTATAPGWCSAAGSTSRPRSTPSSRRRPRPRSRRTSSGIGPSASLVAIENKTGEVKAMVGGERLRGAAVQPGHERPPPARLGLQAVHPDRRPARGRQHRADLRVARRRSSTSRTRAGKEKFEVHNYEDQYSGVASLYTATVNSDNSVYAELGLDIGTRKIARLAQEMGIATEISTNPAMTLGGLTRGRHAARDGVRLQHDRQRRRARVGHARLARQRPGGVREGRGRRDRQGEREDREPRLPLRGRGRGQGAAGGRRPERERARTPRSASSPRARPAPRRTTATPGSSASTRS